MRVNFMGTVWCTRYALAELRKAKGLIAGVATALKRSKPSVAVVGVEPVHGVRPFGLRRRAFPPAGDAERWIYAQLGRATTELSTLLLALDTAAPPWSDTPPPGS